MRKLPILVFFAASLIVCGPDTQRRDERRRSLEIVEALTFFLFYRPCLPFTWIPKGQSRTVTPPFDFDPCRQPGVSSVAAVLTPLGGQDIEIADVRCDGSEEPPAINAAGTGATETTYGLDECFTYDPGVLWRVKNRSGSGDVTIMVN